ncbi:YfhO family protein [Ligilactobacillus sp. LYQ139]|uniref:YfhO family protein n=1 Tax=Ligilactobacillus sp. LYQ139 TaxID=3378800 RepID=UPI0038546F9D
MNQWVKKHTNQIAAFILPVLIMLALFAVCHAYPFGRRLYDNGDMVNQYIAIMAYFRQNWGNWHALIYSHSLGLGGNFFTVWAYYLASPLNLLALLFPVRLIPVFYELNILLVAGLTGLFTNVYLVRSKWLNRCNVSSKLVAVRLILSTGLALSTYFVTNAACIMWFDVIMLLPLLMLALERLLEDEKPGWFGILYGACLLANYYTGYIISVFLVFVVISWLAYQLWIKRATIKYVIKRLVILLIAGSAGLLIGCFTLLPSMHAQKLVSAAPFTITNETLSPLVQLPLGLFNGAISAAQTGIYNKIPMLFTTTLTVILVVTFFLMRRINWREKVICGVGLLIFALSVHFQTTYMIWHAFTMPNGYDHRESFVLVFALTALAYYTAQYYLAKPTQVVYWSIAILISIMGILRFATHGAFIQLHTVCINIILMVIFAVFLRYSFCWNSIALVGLACVDLLSANYVAASQTVAGGLNWPSYSMQEQKMGRVINVIRPSKGSFYRIGTNARINNNDPLQFNYYGLSDYTSQQPTFETDFLSSVGYYQKYSWTRWSNFNNGATRAMNDLLGVKYYVHYAAKSLRLTGAKRQPAYYRNEVYHSGGNQVYRSNTVFPLAFKVSNKTTSAPEPYNIDNNPFFFQNNIWNKIAGRQVNMYSEQRVGRKINNSNHTITYYVVATHTGQAYLYIPVQNDPGVVRVSCNGRILTANLYQIQDDENGIISLGYFRSGNVINVKLRIKHLHDNIWAEYRQLLPDVAVENETAFQQLRNQCTGQINSIRVDGSRISFKTTGKWKNSMVMLTIPFDSGWHIKVDGHAVKPQKLLGTFVGVPVSSGRHDVRLIYQVPKVYSGILGLISGIIILGVECGVLKKRKG